MAATKSTWNKIVYPHNTYHSLDTPGKSLQLRIPANQHGAVSIGLSFLHPMTEKDGKTMGLGRYDITLNRDPNEAEFSFFWSRPTSNICKTPHRHSPCKKTHTRTIRRTSTTRSFKTIKTT